MQPFLFLKYRRQTIERIKNSYIALFNEEFWLYSVALISIIDFVFFFSIISLFIFSNLTLVFTLITLLLLTNIILYFKVEPNDKYRTPENYLVFYVIGTCVLFGLSVTINQLT